MVRKIDGVGGTEHQCEGCNARYKSEVLAETCEALGRPKPTPTMVQLEAVKVRGIGPGIILGFEIEQGTHKLLWNVMGSLRVCYTVPLSDIVWPFEDP